MRSLSLLWEEAHPNWEIYPMYLLERIGILWLNDMLHRISLNFIAGLSVTREQLGSCLL